MIIQTLFLVCLNNQDKYCNSWYIFNHFLIHRVNTTSQKFMVDNIFKIVFQVSYAHHGCIYLINNTATVILWNITI